MKCLNTCDFFFFFIQSTTASWETVVQNPLGHCKKSERNTVVRWKEANKQELVPVWA